MAAVATGYDRDRAVAPKAALTPPTSEDFDKHDDSSSDLSDLEPDVKVGKHEDEGEIEPDHYYEGGKIPVFKPTMDQFRSFKDFISKIDKYGMKSGIVKVIPPKEWRDSLPPLDEAVKSIKVKNPITQEFQGTHGTYTQANIEKQRSYNLPQWRALCDEDNHQPPARRGERRRNQERVARNTRARPAASGNSAGRKRRPGRPRKNPTPEADGEENGPSSQKEEAEEIRVPPTPTSPDAKPMPNRNDRDDESPSKDKDRQQKSVASRRKHNRRDAADQVDEAAFKDFDYRLHHLEEWTPERCSELETGYWKSLTFAPPIYGADMPGSLFDDSTTSWNVAKLENLLDVLGQKIPGVNTAYLYLGMWKATFAWHLEDVDLYSINYIHFGAPKQWYSISQEDARRFEAAMRSIWPNDAKNCSQFLRHKTYLISPTLLQSQFNIRVNRLVHHEGEFVITFPYGYHSGYNLGYNCAESVNFATEAWLDYGRIAKKCDCEADSVWVDVQDIERKLRGETTPEHYDETDFDEEDEEEEASTHGPELPSPPASVTGKPKIQVRKRKREVLDKAVNVKLKHPRLRLKAPAKQPCVLCPNTIPSEPLLPTDNGQKAHRVCALYTPETFLADDNGRETVCNVANIDKARWELRCTYCQLKRGACFQCSQKKCTKAFHGTCAAAAGVRVDFGPTPVFGEDGTEYIGEGFDFRCKIHRPKRPKAQEDGNVLETNAFLLEFAKNVKPGDVIQMKYLQGDIFAGVAVENRPSERSVLVDVLLDGDRVEVEWKWILTLDPEQSQLAPPSSDAKPLPANMSKAAVKSHHRSEGQPTMNTPFCDPNARHKWAEFESATRVSNPYQAKVDLSKAEQLWFYLGETSTEAKAQYTEDPLKRRHNLKSVFLESVKPAEPPLLSLGQRSFPASYPSGGSSQVQSQVQYASMPPPRSQPLYRPDKPYQYKPKIEMPFPRSGPPLTSYRPLSAGSPYASYRPMDNLGHQSYYPNGTPSNRTTASSHSPPLYGEPSPATHSDERQGSYSQGYPEETRSSLADLRPVQRQDQWTQSASHNTQYQQPFYGQQSTSPPLQYHQQNQQSTPSYQSASPYQPYQPYQPYHQQQQQQQPQQRMAPVANMMMGASTPAVTLPLPRKPSLPQMHVSQAQYDSAYIELIQKYPYLRNAYLRRPTKYKSPYAPNGGFTIEYMPLPPRQPPLPRSQHAQYQTPQQFMEQVSQEAKQSQVPRKYERLLSQLGNVGASAPCSLTQSQNPYHPLEAKSPYDGTVIPTLGSASGNRGGQASYSTEGAYSKLPGSFVQPGVETWRYSR